MEHILYVEINIFCVCIMLLLLQKVICNEDMRKETVLFRTVLIDCMILFASDAAWGVIETEAFYIPLTMKYVVNVIYFAYTGILDYHWLQFSEKTLGNDLSDNRRWKIWYRIPLYFLIGLAMTSYWTHWLFFVDETGYHRGNLHFLQILITNGYIVVAVCHALIKAMQKDKFVHRPQYLTMASFGAFLLIFGTLQVLLAEIPFMCVGITLSLISIYCDLLRQMVLVDSLTRINNKNSLLQTLKDKILNYDEEKHLYLLFLDVKDMKQINELFGREEGDKLLICIADTLKKQCAGNDCFVCRYSADNFAIVCEEKNEINMELLCKSIQNEVEIATAEKNYTVVLAAGYAEYHKNFSSIREFIRKAYSGLEKF